MIAVDDRGFALGDGLFETLLVVDGAPKLWAQHMARLEAGCAALGLPTPGEAMCRAATDDALAGLTGRQALRLSWSAGPGGRGLERPDPLSPILVARAAPAPAAGGPARLATSAIRRNEGSPASRLKTLAYLDSVLARRKARAAGADEALMLNNRGELACAAAANLFWLRGRTLLTPALECGVLAGVVRGLLMERAAAQGWSVEAVRAGPEALDDADAIFLTSSLIGVRPVSLLDGRALEPHPAAARLAELVADAL